jgi:hypothetical protein
MTVDEEQSLKESLLMSQGYKSKGDQEVEFVFS